MKIRIQDHSIRFRLTIKETELLEQNGRLESHTEVLGLSGPTGTFHYAVSINDQLTESDLQLDQFGIEMVLCRADASTLLAPNEEGIYLRREWTTEDGELRRFIAFVEKDRPGSTCVKPERWIYETVAGEPLSTIPMPLRK